MYMRPTYDNHTYNNNAEEEDQYNRWQQATAATPMPKTAADNSSKTVLHGFTPIV